MDDDGDEKDDTKRKSRNLSEKKRRDQFNVLVHELSTMVSTNGRKMDKSTVLKSTISFLKNHNEVTVRSRAHDVQEEWKPAFLSNEEFTYLILEALEGFVVVFSSTGRICYISESIKPILGHNPAKVVNKSIFDFTCEEDRPTLYNLLQRHVSATEQIQSASKNNEMIMFELHLKRGLLGLRDEATFELVMFNGHFRTNLEHVGGDHKNYQQNMESSVLFVGMGRLLFTPQLVRDVSLMDPNRGEFTSRHSLEWKFLFLDHRAPPIIGYLPFEVLGTSGYEYYHIDDLDKVVLCHEELMQKGEVTSCYYRFLTKGQQWIWLQTRYYITYHQWHAKPEFVVCTHRVISFADIAKSSKERSGKSDSTREAGNIKTSKNAPSEEAAHSNTSSSYMSDASDAFASSYRTHSPDESNSRVPKEVQHEDATMASMSPSYMSEASEAYGSSYRSHSQGRSKRQRLNDCCHSDDAGVTPLSPSYMSEGSETYNTYGTQSQPASVKSMSSAYGTWKRARRYATGSDTGSVSGDSQSSARHSCRGMLQQSQKTCESALVPQHGIGAQYLEPVPYVGVSTVGLPAVVPVRAVPVIISPNQAQIQLQRKHEELQQMIVKQQEELQQVKEQLLLARLGILQPVISMPYPGPSQLPQPEEQLSQQSQIIYESNTRALPMPYPTQHQPHHPPHSSPHPPHTPHAPGSHQGMHQ